ncbi:MAG TPA: hypothetical protein V6D29_03085 [Leptolyngbyaceae cyanobacterium]
MRVTSAVYLAIGCLLGSAGAALADPPDYYVGAGVRAGLNDSTAAVLNSKAEVADFGDLSLSVRPELMVGSEFEMRLPITVEGQLDQGIYPYAGAGIAYSDGSTINPMVTIGTDLGITNNLVLDVELNVIFKTAASDTDTELVGALNYAF